MGIDKQVLNTIFNAKMPELKSLAKLAISMHCNITDLIEIKRTITKYKKEWLCCFGL